MGPFFNRLACFQTFGQIALRPKNPKKCRKIHRERVWRGRNSLWCRIQVQRPWLASIPQEILQESWAGGEQGPHSQFANVRPIFPQWVKWKALYNGFWSVGQKLAKLHKKVRLQRNPTTDCQKNGKIAAFGPRLHAQGLRNYPYWFKAWKCGICANREVQIWTFVPKCAMRPINWSFRDRLTNNFKFKTAQKSEEKGKEKEEKIGG